jgi:hypothetical protein
MYIKFPSISCKKIESLDEPKIKLFKSIEKSSKISNSSTKTFPPNGNKLIQNILISYFVKQI